MSEVIVVATISPKPGEEQAVRDAVLAAIPPRCTASPVAGSTHCTKPRAIRPIW